MPKILMPYTVHLDHTLRVTPVSTLFYKGDSNAHRFELNVLSKGLQADLSGCTAVYRFYRLQDSTVVSNPASIENGKVVAVLDKACYDYIGRFALTIAIQNGEDETTVFYGDGYMSGNRADTGITGDYVVYDVETLLAKIAEIETAIANANTATENANAAESERVAAEEYRVGHESTRQMHENDRVAHEKTRISSETTRRNAETDRAAAETARSDAETARAEAEQQRAVNEEARAAAEQARQETFAGYEDRIVAATPDDTTVDGRAWTSKKTVDSLCLPFEATGNTVQCYPVEGYPLGVKASWAPVQAGSGDPSPDNIRPITGRDSVSITIGNGMDSKTTDIALPETVYGGKLDLSTGVVTVEWYKLTMLPNVIRKEDYNTYCFTTLNNHNAPSAKGGAENAISNVMKSEANISNIDTGNRFALFSSGIIRIRIDGITTLDEMVAYATENPIEIAYRLAEPYNIQLTAQQIAALSGVNTIYTDAGTLTVTGREDPRHTIVTLADRIAALESAAAGV